MYSSTLSVTSALDVVGSQRHAPAALPPVPIIQEGGWAPRTVWGSPPPGFDPRTVQPVGVTIPTELPRPA